MVVHFSFLFRGVILACFMISRGGGKHEPEELPTDLAAKADRRRSNKSLRSTNSLPEAPLQSRDLYTYSEPVVLQHVKSIKKAGWVT